PAGTDVGVSHQVCLLDEAILGDGYDKAPFSELLDRHHGNDLLAFRFGELDDAREVLAFRTKGEFGKLVNLDVVNSSKVRETQQSLMVTGHKHTVYNVFFARQHTRFA